MNPTAERAPAKINLYLKVTGRRSDGYHLLDSLAVFAGIADRLTFTPSDTLSLALNGPFAPALSTESDNLVLRAARRLAAEAGVLPTGTLTLDKNIPVASGIGGGSADAAAALRLLCRVWRLSPEEAVLDRIATALGADVPVCLRSRPMRMGGVGDVLTPAPVLPSCGLLLVNPGIPLSTASVFRARGSGFSPRAALPDGWDTVAAMAASLDGLSNDLEAAAIGIVPAIGDVLRFIAEARGCLLARMSGSGATCFGLFGDPADAAAAAARPGRPRWWAWGGPLAR